MHSNFLGKNTVNILKKQPNHERNLQMTEISQEDKKAIDNLFDKLEAAFTTGTEVTLTKIGDCVSKMPIDDLRPLGGLVKKYGYYGAFLAIQQSIEQRDLGSVGKYYY
ncbi:MAG: hypothetical protein ACLU99_14430 [Alphaproteobacteria bacterium]